MEDGKKVALPVWLNATVTIRAWLLAEHLDPRSLEHEAVLGRAPLTLCLPGDSVAVLFHYGALVLFNASDAIEREFLNRVAPLLIEPLIAGEKDETRLRLTPATDEQVDPTGTIMIREISVERIQLIATVLAKSAVLSHYEMRLTDVFARIDPLAADLAKRGRSRGGGAELMRHIGAVLLIQHKMVGRVEIGDKPDLLWDHPELERFYARLAEVYELHDRDHALDRKLDVIAGTAQTLIGLVQSQSNLRMEWYIAALIVAELILSILPPSGW